MCKLRINVIPIDIFTRPSEFHLSLSSWKADCFCSICVATHFSSCALDYWCLLFVQASTNAGRLLWHLQTRHSHLVADLGRAFFSKVFLLFLLCCFSLFFCLSPKILQVGDALIAINNVTVQGLSFNEIMRKMKKSLREDPCIVLRFRTMEERYRLLRMKVIPWLAF